MFVKRLVLTDLKGFTKLDFTFTRPSGHFSGWTVITGENGSGKTALLKALALALVGPDVARTLQPSFRGWIRAGLGRGEVAVQIVPEESDRFTTGRRYLDSFWSELELEQDGVGETSLKVGNRRRHGKKGPLNGPWAENTQGWFAAGYGPFRRLYGASPEAQRLMVGPSRVARFATMFKEDATLGECEIWLRELAHKKLEGRPRETELLRQIIELLNDDFLRNGLAVERVDSEGLWLRDRIGTVLHLSDMSEGYRAALAMMVDILRHMAESLRAESLIEHQADQLVVPHSGVVLIDEVDAHLHPEWQRMIGLWLKRRFPKVQFIVTTHSALICQAADEKGLFHLPAPGSDALPFQLADEDYQKVVRARPDEILLTPAFGMSHTRAPFAVNERIRHAELAAKSRGGELTSDEGAELRQLELMLEPGSGPSAPD